MKKILSATVLALAASSAVALPASSASAVEPYAICVQEGPTISGWSAIIMESEAELASYQSRYITAPFPTEQGQGGCSFYTYNPPQFTASEPCPVVETSSVQTVVPKGYAPVAPYKATIKRLHSKIAKLKAQLAAQR